MSTVLDVLHWLDWTVLAIYFLLVLLVGFLAARRIKGTGDYFLGGRSFSKWLVMGQAFGVGTHAEMPVSLAGAVYQSGYSAIWYQWKNLFITPFYWILAPIFRRLRRTTTGEVYEDRYGRSMGAVYTIFALSYFLFNMGAMLKGAGKLVSAAAGGAITPNTVVLAMTAAFLTYAAVGGKFATAWTDFFQGFLIIGLSFMLIPMGLARIGGFSTLRESLSPQMLSLVTPGDVGVFTIVMLTINGLIGIVAQPHILPSIGTGKDEHACRAGMAYGNFIKRACTIGWALVGLIVAVMLLQSGEQLADREEAFGYATRHLLFPGSVGLMIACVLAANMSTCSAFFVDSGALFTNNFYKPYVAQGRSDRHYLTIGRFAGILTTALGVIFGLYVDVVLEAFLFTETIAAFMGISMIAGVSWRRANRTGAFLSLVVSSAVFFWLTHRQFGEFLRWDPTNFGLALAAGFAALIGGSLLTAPENGEKLQPFYERLDTPAFRDPLTGRETGARQPGHDLLAVHLTRLPLLRWHELWKRFRVDLSGLLLCFGIVVALVLLAKIILYLP
jgi:Na+/proline symporter